MKKAIELYLDWTNNYLAVDTFAEHHAISVTLATALIREGRILHYVECGDFGRLSDNDQNHYLDSMQY